MCVKIAGVKASIGTFWLLTLVLCANSLAVTESELLSNEIENISRQLGEISASLERLQETQASISKRTKELETSRAELKKKTEAHQARARDVENLCQGRLTLTSGTPVTTSDVTAASTLYFTPYGGNKITLYTGVYWQPFTFTERSLALSGLTSD